MHSEKVEKILISRVSNAERQRVDWNEPSRYGRVSEAEISACLSELLQHLCVKGSSISLTRLMVLGRIT